MMRLNELCTVTYGNKFDLNKMKRRSLSSGGVNFIGRSERRQGISAMVAPIRGIAANPAGLITVALGGSLLASFVQEHPFYTAQNVAVLTPLSEMSFSEKLYLCLCIRRNRFRYSAFGREANRTLRTLPVPSPDEIPDWVRNRKSSATMVAKNCATAFEKLQLDDDDESDELDDWLTVGELFSNQYGNSYELANLQRDSNGFNFVSRRMGNNGVSARVAQTDDEPFPAGLLTVALSGNGVLETCVQPTPFYTGFHVSVLTPKKEMNLAAKLFYARAIALNRFRYGFGRQANRSLPRISLPPLPSWASTQTVQNVKRHVALTVNRRFAATV
jgi:hypothetical protein